MAEIPQILGGRYEVGELVGRGGMAQVHVGYDTRLSRTVAIKVLRSDHATDPTFIARFRREAQSAAALNHPSIVAVYDTGEETITDSNNRESVIPYIVMEYVKGQTVSQLLKNGDALPIDEAIQVVVGVLSALEYSHREGIIHRDIKPGNIMLTSEGKVKVMDFGIARAIADSAATMTQTNSVVGTAQYLSPEQARGEVVDSRSDLYSTGCLLYELLTGQPPFRGDSAVAVAYQHVSEAPKPPKSIASDIPDSLDRVVMKALAKRREDRYQSAGEMRRELLASSRGQHVTAPAVSSWQTEQISAPTQVAPVVPTPTTISGTQTATQPTVTQTGNVPAQTATKKKNRGYIIVGVILLLLALVGLSFALFGGKKSDEPPATETVAVPDLRGTTQVEARQLITDAGLVFAMGDPQEDDTIPEGEFVSSDPAIDTQVDVGSTVTVFFSSGVGTVTMPDLATGNYDQNSARSALEDLGLEVGRVDVADVPGKAADVVTETSEAAGSEIPRGTAVDLTVASGEISIKDLTGLEVTEAESYLRDELKIPNITVVEEESTEFAPGRVIRMDPVPGKHAYDTAVTILIAKAPAVQPDPEPTEPPTEEPTEEPSSTLTEETAP